ncbi:hypothetical protein AHAS_Ahas11G0204200 [Arachis hypogaea]
MPRQFKVPERKMKHTVGVACQTLGVPRQFNFPERRRRRKSLGVPLEIEGMACQANQLLRRPWACHLGSKAWHARESDSKGVQLEELGMARQAKLSG